MKIQIPNLIGILAGLREPAFFQEEFFRVLLWRRTDVSYQITPQNYPPPIKEELTNLELSVLALIEKNNKITITQISVNLEIGRDTVKEYIKRLKEKQKITRIGGNRGGYWKILKNN